MSINSTIFTKSSSQTKKIAEKIIKEILRKFKGKRALVLALEGELGAGKTVFVKGISRVLGLNEREILSPTFIIMKKFSIDYKGFKRFYHVDCYRIEKEKEIKKLGFSKILKNPQNIVAIEWADKIKNLLPKKTFYFKFEILDKQTRKIIIK